MNTLIWMFWVLSALCFGCLLATQADDREGLLDGIVRNVLEGLRDDIRNLTIADQTIFINTSGITVNLSLSDISLNNVAEYNITYIQSTLLPIEVKNLSLFWDYIEVVASYNIEGTVGLDVQQEPVEIYGSGLAMVDIENLFITTGAKFTSVAGKLQIREDGLYGFDIVFPTSRITIQNFMESPEISEIVSAFFSYFFKLVVDDFKCVVFNDMEPLLIQYANEILKDVNFP